MSGPDHPRRNAVMPDRADLELRVEPVIRCSRCGDPLPFSRIGRCDQCIGRGGNPIGCLVLAIAFLIGAFIAASVLVGSGTAAPRSAPEPTALLDEDPRPFDEPIPARGSLGLWTWDGHRP